MENLEKLYSPSQWCSYRCNPDLVVDKHIEVVTKESEEIKNNVRFVENIRYGDKPKQLLDLFEPAILSHDTPTFVYIHGGYWQSLNKEISRYCVKPLLKNNIRIIIPGYDLAPSVTMETIVDEIESLGRFVQDLATKRNWKNLWFGGHSAGAHLTASLLCSEVSSSMSIRGFILISGIYSLEPLIHTSINEKLNLTSERCRFLSPLLKLADIRGRKFKVILIVAEFDSPAFHQQSIDFKQEMEKLNFDATMQIIQNTDHFTIVENLKDENFILTKIIVDYILQRTTMTEKKQDIEFESKIL